MRRKHDKIILSTTEAYRIGRKRSSSIIFSPQKIWGLITFQSEKYRARVRCDGSKGIRYSKEVVH